MKYFDIIKPSHSFVTNYLAPLLILIGQSSCNKEQPLPTKPMISSQSKPSATKELVVFPNYNTLPDAKLWAHRTNDISSANEALKQFQGIEFDVVFGVNTAYFDVRHDISDTPKNLDLLSFFEGIDNPSESFYWIDFKNCTDLNVEEAILRLNFVLDSTNLRNRVIIESSNPSALSKIGEAGFYTSYWIPHFIYNENFETTEMDAKNTLHENLGLFRFNAISAHYPMYNYLNHFFPKQNIHLWTNGLEGEQDKPIIGDLAQKDNIHVILVDYKTNFLKDTSLVLGLEQPTTTRKAALENF